MSLNRTRIWTTVLLVSALSLPGAAASDSFRHEFQSTANVTAIVSEDFDIAFGVTYRYLLATEALLQIGANLTGANGPVAGASLTENNDVFRGVFLLGGWINFQETNILTKAWFLGAQAGVAVDSISGAGATSDTDFAYAIDGGKRFQLAERVTYTPQIQLFQILDRDLQVRLIPFSFSIFF